MLSSLGDPVWPAAAHSTLPGIKRDTDSHIGQNVQVRDAEAD